MTAVRLHLAPIDLTADHALDAIAANETLRNCAWKTISGTATMTVFTETDTVAETIKVVRCATHAGFNVLRVYEDRVNIGEMTRRLGDFSREAVRKWTADPTFPAHRSVLNDDGQRGATKIWDWADVVAWLQQHKSLALDEALPTEPQIAEINAALCGVRDYASHDTHQMLFNEPASTAAMVYTFDHEEGPLRVATAGWAFLVDPATATSPSDTTNRPDRDAQHA